MRISKLLGSLDLHNTVFFSIRYLNKHNVERMFIRSAKGNYSSFLLQLCFTLLYVTILMKLHLQARQPTLLNDFLSSTMSTHLKPIVLTKLLKA